MSKKWAIDVFFEKYLGKFYKKAPNDKMELMGKDGLNHGMYAALISIGVGSVLHWVFHMTGGIYALGMFVTFVAIIAFFFFLEVGQERARLDRHNMEGNPLLWFKQPNAQIDDFKYPAIASAITCILMVAFNG